MNNIFFIAAIVFLYIAYGATWKWTHPHPNGFVPPISMFVFSERALFYAEILNNIIYIIGYIIPAICICKLTNISWYWSALINLIAVSSISHIIASIYVAILGYKTKEEMFDFTIGSIRRNPIYGIDAIITVCIGVVSFIIAIFI
jgi:hypothetical protein